jgi:uncharacterized Rmd1/YagE family protein
MTNDLERTEARKRVRALLISDRIDTANLERPEIVSNTPFAYRTGSDGIVTLFRYGVAVFAGLTPAVEDEILEGLTSRLVRPVPLRDEEIAYVALDPDKDDHVLPGGPIRLKALTPEHMIVIADALAKSVALARDERQVAAAFDTIEPLARQLAEHGKTPEGRRAILKHIGNALLVQQRVTGRVAVAEKPDVVWDRPDLDRLYGRLEDEYELKERAELLSHKLSVIADTAKVLTDIIDTRRALRLEFIVVVLIAIEIVIAAYQYLRG